LPPARDTARPPNVAQTQPPGAGRPLCLTPYSRQEKSIDLLAIRLRARFPLRRRRQNWKPNQPGHGCRNSLPDPNPKVGHCVHPRRHDPSLFPGHALQWQKHWKSAQRQRRPTVGTKSAVISPRFWFRDCVQRHHEPGNGSTCAQTRATANMPVPEGKLRIYRRKSGRQTSGKRHQGPIPAERC